VTYSLVRRPIQCPEAFARKDDRALQSQAALLLLLGNQQPQEVVRNLPDVSHQQFPIPHRLPRAARSSVERVRNTLTRRYGRWLFNQKTQIYQERYSGVLLDLAERLYRNPKPLIAAELLEVSLRHPDSLVQVAAAASLLRTRGRSPSLIRVLIEGIDNPDELVRQLAAMALAVIESDHPSVRRLLKRKASDAARHNPSHTSTLVHGTFARQSTWWQPGGEFHTYLLNSVRPDLYSASDRFDWSGGYSDRARADGARKLVAWAEARNLDGLDLFTHSHGGSVAMLASHKGLSVTTLVLLSCPVHPAKYLPNFSSISRAVSIRVQMDLVILLDQGGQLFQHPQIEEHILPIWFQHSATHSPDVWKKHVASGWT